MNRTLVDRIASAVLYEGYILYPYRPSLKNRQRWTFGGLYPEAYCRHVRGSDAPACQTECLVHGGQTTAVEAVVRFLHLTARRIGVLEPPLPSWPPAPECFHIPFHPVPALKAGGHLHHTWQEAEEREVAFPATTLAEMAERPHSLSFAFPGGERREPIEDSDGKVIGMLLREQQPIEGLMEARALALGDDLYRLTLRVQNTAALAAGDCQDRDQALLRCLTSTHTILAVEQGELVSLLDPPPAWQEAASACRNQGTWPVLVGQEGQKDTMLSSPIILYDYPQVAAESPGDFFDATEIDEMLTLRILTLTEDEKRAMANLDARTRALLARTERLAEESLSGLHGTLRDVQPVLEEEGHG